MVSQLIVAGAWLALAVFFLFVNLKTRRAGVAKVLTYWGMVFSAGVAIVVVGLTTLEVLNG